MLFPEIGEPRGTWLYHCRKKWVFGFFMIIFGNCQLLWSDCGRGTSGNLQVPQSWRCWTLAIWQNPNVSILHCPEELKMLKNQNMKWMSLSLGDLTMRVSQFPTDQTTRDFLIIWDFGELFGHLRLPHLSTFSRTFWVFSEKLKTKIEILPPTYWIR